MNRQFFAIKYNNNKFVDQYYMLMLFQSVITVAPKTIKFVKSFPLLGDLS